MPPVGGHAGTPEPRAAKTATRGDNYLLLFGHCQAGESPDIFPLATWATWNRKTGGVCWPVQLWCQQIADCVLRASDCAVIAAR